MNGPSTPRRTRLLAIGVLVATFATGMLAATAVDQALAARGPAPAPERAWSCKGGPEGKTRAILDQLDLTPEQRTRIDAVMERRRAQADAFWEREGPRFRSIVDSTRAEVRAVLTPEQRSEYDRIREQYRAARRAEKEAQKQAARAGER